MKVLVIEDHKEYYQNHKKAFKAILGLSDDQMEFVDNVDQAINQLGNIKPQIIITDMTLTHAYPSHTSISLPDGREVLAGSPEHTLSKVADLKVRLKELELNSLIIFYCLYTNASDPAIRDQALNLGSKAIIIAGSTDKVDDRCIINYFDRTALMAAHLLNIEAICKCCGRKNLNFKIVKDTGIGGRYTCPHNPNHDYKKVLEKMSGELLPKYNVVIEG